MARYWWHTRDIVAATGLSAEQVRGILSAYHASGKYGKDIEKGGSWRCREHVYTELFGAIVDERQREQQAEADARLADANALIERRRYEAEIRRMQAEQRRDAIINTARSRHQAVTRRRMRKAAHFRLAAVKE